MAVCEGGCVGVEVDVELEAAVDAGLVASGVAVFVGVVVAGGGGGEVAPESSTNPKSVVHALPYWPIPITLYVGYRMFCLCPAEPIHMPKIVSAPVEP